MKKENIIQFAIILKSIFIDKDCIEIAQTLGYEVEFVDEDIRVTNANTYNYGSGKKIIKINALYDRFSRNVICAHELGHAILNHKYKNAYKGINIDYEYEANLFAVALLFENSDFNIEISQMSNYTLQSILEKNINKLGR